MNVAESQALLADALDRLGSTLDADVRDRRRRDAEARERDPEFRAELEAKRHPLRKWPFAAVVRGIPELAEAFQTKVPGNFFTVIEGRVEVPCPCKGATVYPALEPAPCPAAERTDCPRWYVFDGEDVRVAFSPRGGAPTPQDDEPIEQTSA